MNQEDLEMLEASMEGMAVIWVSLVIQTGGVYDGWAKLLNKDNGWV